MSQRSTLERRRRELGRWRVARMEGFVYVPLETPDVALFFADAPGIRRRRLRRLMTLVAFLLALYAAGNLWRTWRTALDTATARAEAQVQVEERQARRAALTVDRLAEAPPPLNEQTSVAIGIVNEDLLAIANSLPAGSELTRIDVTPETLSIAGLSHDPIALELELRRRFAQRELYFASQSTLPSAVPFEVLIRFDAESEAN